MSNQQVDVNDFFTVEPMKSKAVSHLDKAAAIAMSALVLMILTVISLLFYAL